MIERKKKICKICKQLTNLWSRGCCKSCWFKAFGKPISSSKKVIKKISDKHKERLKRYQKLRDAFLLGKTCSFPECVSKEVECHHSEGRVGNNLFQGFVALCHKHHMWVETHPLEARELDLSKSRLTNEKQRE